MSTYIPAGLQKFPGCPFPIIASPLPTLLTFVVIPSLWPSPVHIQYFTWFISQDVTPRTEYCLPVIIQWGYRIRFGEKLFRSIINIHQGAGYLPREQKQNHAPLGFVCRVNMSRTLNYYKSLCFLFLSDELKISGTIGQGSHGCVSATSTKGQPSLSSLTEALFSLPLTFYEEGKKGILSPAAWRLQRMAWFF